MLTVVERLSKSICTMRNKRLFRLLSTAHTKLTEHDVEETKIPVPWGHIAGRWWGSQSQQPVLCIHGWQDNANSFNRLIPLLPTEYSYLAIDLPGHGFSSHLPQGVSYSILEYLSVLRRLQLHFGWDKISFINHSLGGACGFLFSACFPEAVNFFVAIDTLKTLTKIPTVEHKRKASAIEKMLVYDSRDQTTSPFYSKKDLLQRWIKGTDNKLSEQSCLILMERGTEVKNGMYRLRRDGRVKTNLGTYFSQKENLKLAENISCSVLNIKAKDSPYYEDKSIVLEVMKVIKSKAKHFEHQELPGSHHLHLNNPETVAPVITTFIKTVEGQ